MEIQNWIYLISQVVLFIIFIIAGWKGKFDLFWKMKYMVPAIIISGALFIFWAVRFTELNIWQINSASVTGLYIFKLPVEIWLYYIVLPLNVFMLYELAKKKFNPVRQPNYLVILSLFLLVVFAVLAYAFRKNAYSFIVFIFTTLFLGYIIFRNRFKPFYAVFYTTFLISLVPFYVLEGIANNLPVAEYYNAYISGIRIFYVPVENIAGFFLLALLNIFIYEFLKGRKFY